VVTDIATVKVTSLMIALAVRGGFKLGSAAGLAAVVATCSVPAAGIELPWRSMVACDASDSKEKAEKSDTGRANMRTNGSSSVEYFPISLAASLKSPQRVRSFTFSRYDVGDISMCAIVCCNFPSISNQLCFNLYIYRNTQGSKAKTDVFQIVQSRLSEVVTVMSRTGENKEKTSSKLRT
jgi:hypothetical protein